MLDRHQIGDVILAILIAVPAASLAQPDWTPHRHGVSHSVPAKQSAVVLASAADRQVGLFR
ncbi:MAG: hypothetical protein ACJ8F4_05480 [Sphingomonas sp.]